MPLLVLWWVKMRTNKLIATTCLLLVGCSASHRSQDEDAIREVVFRDSLQHYDKAGILIFLSFGGDTDPPDAFLARLRGLKSTIRKGSDAMMTKPGTEAGISYGLIRDRTTNELGTLTTVVIRRWINDSEVEASLGNVRGGLNGEGYTCTVKKTDGRWRIESKRHRWVS
jgi:hypothetical protein